MVKKTASSKLVAAQREILERDEFLDFIKAYAQSSSTTTKAGPSVPNAHVIRQGLRGLLALEFIDRHGVHRNFLGPVSSASSQVLISAPAPAGKASKLFGKIVKVYGAGAKASTATTQSTSSQVQVAAATEDEIPSDVRASKVLGSLPDEAKLSIATAALGWKTVNKQGLTPIAFYIFNDFAKRGLKIKKGEGVRLTSSSIALGMLNAAFKSLGTSDIQQVSAWASKVSTPPSIPDALGEVKSRSPIKVQELLSSVGVEVNASTVEMIAFDSLKELQTKNSVEPSDIQKAINACSLAIDSAVEPKNLKSRNLHPVQIILGAFKTPKTILSELPRFLQKCADNNWFKDYDGVHPLWMFAQIEKYRLRPEDFKKITECLDVLLKAGFKPDGTSPVGKLKRFSVQDSLLVEWVKDFNTDSNTDFESQIRSFVSAGADLQEPNRSGRSAMSILNTQSKRVNASSGKRAESLFLYLASQGADPLSIVPQKEATDLAGTPSIKALIGAYMERMAILGAMDSEILNEAIEIAKKLKEERQPKSTTLGKSLRI